MPGSVAEGKDLVKDFCLNHDIKYVLDIGPGEGTYYHALKDANLTRLDGVEVWGPYIDEFQLKDKYNKIYISDIYYFDFKRTGILWDMIIFGDVIEHMPIEQGRVVIEEALKHSRYIVISLPIYGYYQTQTVGNTYETHVEQYSDESIRRVLAPYEIVEAFKGDTVGVYIVRRTYHF